MCDASAGRILNIGHRGAMGMAPENTIAAIEAAAGAAADMVAIDVPLSRDRELVSKGGARHL